MTSLLLQNSYLQQTTLSKIDTMDEMDYAFYLAYGMTQEAETQQSLLDVKMYSTIDAESQQAIEASHRDFLASNP